MKYLFALGLISLIICVIIGVGLEDGRTNYQADWLLYWMGGSVLIMIPYFTKKLGEMF